MVSGNAFIDMLNGNGIPIGSSIRGLEDAIRTQRDMENTDPSEQVSSITVVRYRGRTLIFHLQIAKAVLDKFQTQILPGLVANMIAGRNPFKMPQQMRKAQAAPSSVLQMALAQKEQLQMHRDERNGAPMTMREERIREREQEGAEAEEPQTEDEHHKRDLLRRLRNSPRLKGLLQV